jgi:hypothetical protein
MHIHQREKQGCPSVEAKANRNGAVLARIGRGHVEPLAEP